MKTINSKFFPAFLMAVLLQSISTIAFAKAGEVVFTFGDVQIIDKNGNAKIPVKGDVIESGDQLKTLEGRIQILFEDGAYISLQPNSEYAVQKYNYTGKQDGTEQAIFRLLKGGLRAVTGLIGKKNSDAYKVHTATATIGIRGTGHNTRICSGDCFNLDGSLLADGLYHTTWEGQTYVANDAGRTDVPVGTSVFVRNNTTKAKKVKLKSAVLASTPAAEKEEEEEQEDDNTVSESSTEKEQVQAEQVSNTEDQNQIFTAGEQRLTNGTQSIIVNPADTTANGLISFGGGGDVFLDATFNRNNISIVETISNNSGERVLITAGTNQIVDLFDDGIIFMNRWTNGEFAILTLDGPNQGNLFTADVTNERSVHTVLGTTNTVPVPVIGNASYSFLASTDSTQYSGGFVGNGITNGTISVDFLNANINLIMNVNHANNYTVSGTSPIQNFTFTANGLSADIIGTGVGGTFNATGGVGACSGSCPSNVFGFFAGTTSTAVGNAPNRIGLIYDIFETDPIHGAGAFKLDSVTP